MALSPGLSYIQDHKKGFSIGETDTAGPPLIILIEHYSIHFGYTCNFHSKCTIISPDQIWWLKAEKLIFSMGRTPYFKTLQVCRKWQMGAPRMLGHPAIQVIIQVMGQQSQGLKPL